ncbi:MAG: SDR family NAD(P)-dependent oxidoreductase [Treponema sp.]|nr:SDR family NAD(P)-dependent oxidoreductase [Treponema sp.]
MHKHVLITGGAGFIGSNVALKLVAQGYDVTVLDSLEKQIHGETPENSQLYMSIKDKVDFVKGSVTDREVMERMLCRADVVIHLAAETGTGQSMYEIEKYCRTNIGGTALLLDILANKKTPVKKVIVAESRAIYGEGKYSCENCGTVYPLARKESDMANGDFAVKCPFCGQNINLVATDESSKIHPTSVYGITKQVQGQLVHCVCQAIGIPSVSFRYQNVYGPGQSLKNPYTGILSIFSNSLRQNHDINIFEDGTESRDFVYIDDVADATILAIENDRCAYKAFNVGTGKSIDVMTVAQYLKEFYKSDSEIRISSNFRLGDIRHNYADISLAREILGYEPKFTFEQGLKKFCEWVLTQPVEQDNYKKSLDEMKEKGLYK